MLTPIGVGANVTVNVYINVYTYIPILMFL
jgi:hypothetical protein